MIQQTLILIKPDGIKKCLIGKIISRLEDTGLKVCALKMVWPDEELAEKHYPLEEEWARGTFEKARLTAEKDGRAFKPKDYMEFGGKIQSALREYIKESPVIAIIVKGPHAIEIVRKIIGNTEPRQSPPGTIRGDFASIESYQISVSENRAVRNLIHASDSVENAKREIELWFESNEVHDY